MSVRLYVGNLPQNVNVKELEALLTSLGDGIKFKAVFDRDTKACRGFGFANVKDESVADDYFADQVSRREQVAALARMMDLDDENPVMKMKILKLKKKHIVEQV